MQETETGIAAEPDAAIHPKSPDRRFLKCQSQLNAIRSSSAIGVEIASTAAAIGTAVSHNCTDREPADSDARWMSRPRFFRECQLSGEQG